jgi:dephospho-CoA kinase
MKCKLVIGLIGGMGSGKSLVAHELERRGAKVISGDRLGHEALRQPEIRDKLVERWGKQILDNEGKIDRPKVAAIVFVDPEERRALEALVHPWIERRLGEEIAAAEADPAIGLVVLDAAVMLEAGWNKMCERLVYVDAPREVRLRRLAKQRGWTAKEVEAREKVQMRLADKRKRADDVVDSSGTPEQLTDQVERLLQRWASQKVNRQLPD